MFLCRIISIFFLLYTAACGSITAKNVSQADIDINPETVCRLETISKVESDLNDLYEDTDQTLTCSGEGFEESNATFSDDSIFDDDRFGHVIEKFINEMEVFWESVKALIAEENDKSKLAGNWWHGDTEDKYNQMKEKFYKNAPAELPQKVKDIIDEYEMRYNDLMWSEIENMIISEVNQDNIISDAVPSCASSTNKIEKSEGQSKENIKGSTNDNKKCKKRSFEDVFQVKITTKTSGFSSVKCDD